MGFIPDSGDKKEPQKSPEIYTEVEMPVLVAQSYGWAYASCSSGDQLSTATERIRPAPQA